MTGARKPLHAASRTSHHQKEEEEEEKEKVEEEEEEEEEFFVHIFIRIYPQMRTGSNKKNVIQCTQ